MLVFVKDFVVVVLGVFVALLIDRWRERRKNREFLNRALGILAENVRENRKEIEKALNEHTILLRKFLKVKPWDRTPLSALLSRFSDTGGIFVFLPRRGLSGQIFIGERASMLDTSVLSILSDIEEATEYMYEMYYRISDHLINRLDSPLHEDRIRLIVLLDTIVKVERDIVRLYDRFLKSVDTRSF